VILSRDWVMCGLWSFPSFRLDHGHERDEAVEFEVGVLVEGGVPRGVEFLRWLDDGLGGEGFAGIVLGEEFLHLGDQRIGGLLGNGVTVDLQLEGLPEVLSGSLVSDALGDGLVVVGCFVAVLQGDEHFLVPAARRDAGGDGGLAGVRLEVVLLGNTGQLRFVDSERAVECFDLAAALEDSVNQAGHLAFMVGDDGISLGRFLRFLGDGAEVEFLDAGFGRSWCCSWHDRTMVLCSGWRRQRGEHRPRCGKTGQAILRSPRRGIWNRGTWIRLAGRAGAW